MSKKTLAIAGLVLITAGALGAFYFVKHKSAPVVQPPAPKETFSAAMQGIQNAEVMTEKDFLMSMIPHQQEAIDTAKNIAKGTTNPSVKELAEKIASSQQVSLTNMKTWYAAWYKEAYKPNNTDTSTMPDLTSLQGKEKDRAFLEAMINHHMEALMMAQQVSRDAEHDEIKKFTQAIAETQSAEVIEMRILLKQL